MRDRDARFVSGAAGAGPAAWIDSLRTGEDAAIPFGDESDESLGDWDEERARLLAWRRVACEVSDEVGEAFAKAVSTACPTRGRHALPPPAIPKTPRGGVGSQGCGGEGRARQLDEGPAGSGGAQRRTGGGVGTWADGCRGVHGRQQRRPVGATPRVGVRPGSRPAAGDGPAWGVGGGVRRCSRGALAGMGRASAATAGQQRRHVPGAAAAATRRRRHRRPHSPRAAVDCWPQ